MQEGRETSRDRIRAHLEDVLERAEDQTIRYDVRQALQLLHSIQSAESSGPGTDAPTVANGTTEEE